MRTADRLLLTVLRSGWPWTVALAAVTLADSTASILLPGMLGVAVDTILDGRPRGPVLLLLSGVLATAVLAGFLHTVLLTRISADRTAALRRDVVRHVLRRGIRTNRPAGDL